jgi:predicted Abi (CAAX) family protease
MPQAVIILNMLRTSIINPKLSAATHLDGQRDYTRVPMAPPGSRIIELETPSRRRTWAPHGQNGWYIGPALEHYRYYTVYITTNRIECIIETDEFLPTEVAISFL